MTEQDLIDAFEPSKILEFFKSKTGEYDYVEPGECAIAQYLKSVFPDERIQVIPYEARVGTFNHHFTEDIEHSVSGGRSGVDAEWTFEAAAARLEKRLSNANL